MAGIGVVLKKSVDFILFGANILVNIPSSFLFLVSPIHTLYLLPHYGSPLSGVKDIEI
jgi:hypothetical protein